MNATSLSLPQKIEDVTSFCVERMLNQKYPGTEITQFHIGQIIHGSATKLRLTLDYNQVGHEHGLPPTMWMKADFTDHGLADQAMVQETWFYEHLAEEIGDYLPDCYFAQSDGKQGVTLLEDLLAKNANFRDATEPATKQEAKFLLKHLAAVHGKFWQGDQLDQLNEPKRESGAFILDFSRDVLYQPENFHRCMALPRCAAAPEKVRDISYMQSAIAKLIEAFDEQPKTLMHGDPHFGNTYTLPHGKGAGFVDWQSYTRGIWAFDVAYFMGGALAAADREQWEQELLRYYLTELEASGGPKLPFDEAWLTYRKFFFYAVSWILCPPEMQPEEICVANAEKVLAGLEQLKCFEALGLE